MTGLLTILILLPLVAAVLTAALKSAAKMIAIGGSVLTFLLSLMLLSSAHATPGSGFILEQNAAWLPVLNIRYHVAVDGASAALVLLTTFLSVCAVFYSADKVKDRTNHYLALLLVMEAATIGAFVSLDLILFYLFFEVCLIPVYFLIGIWGGSGSNEEKSLKRRIAAANRFFLYTVVGSLLMLAAIIAVYLKTGSFEYDTVRMAFTTWNVGTTETAFWIFAGFAIAFAVKTGVFPFHSWLPDAYAEAPTGTVVLLSGAMAKLGTYGFFRFCLGMFPFATKQFAPVLVALGVISIIYGALVAAVQRDAKRVIAYSSISHLGFVVLGLFSLVPIGVQGALLQQINHGITAGVLFLIIGMIQERRGTTYIRDLGGLWEQMPLFGRIFLIATLSSVGLPLTNGFVGEFQILLGTVQAYPVAGAIATTGVIWSAVYMLWMFQRVMYGSVTNPANRRLRDISGSEVGVLIPFVALIFILGLFPVYATQTMAASMQQPLDSIQHLPSNSGNPGARGRRGR